MKTKKTNMLSRALLAFIMIFPILVGAIGGFSSPAKAAGENVNVTLHKRVFINDEAYPGGGKKQNTGNEIPDFGGNAIAGAGFTVYDVTEAYHAAYEAAFNDKTQNSATAGNYSASVAEAVVAVKNNTTIMVNAEALTNKDGKVVFSLPAKKGDVGKEIDAVYMFKETTTPKGVTTAADNMILAFPMPDSVTNKLDIHLYPKNKMADEVTVEKSRTGYDHEINENIDYQIISTLPTSISQVEGANSIINKYIITDTHNSALEWVANKGLTANVFKVVGGIPTTEIETITLDPTTDYSLSADTGTGFTVTLTQSGINKLIHTSDNKLTFKFQMKIKHGSDIADGLGAGEFGNKADVYARNNTGTEYNANGNEVLVASAGFKFKKIDGSSKGILAGAKFIVKDPDQTDESKQYWLPSTSTWGTAEAAKADSGVLTSDANGEFTVKGLKEKQYELYEISAPDGYVFDATKPISFTPVVGKKYATDENAVNTKGTVVDADGKPTTLADTGIKVLDPAIAGSLKDATLALTVENFRKGFLPSTGGKGIYMFLAVGAVFVVAVGIWFAKNRKEETEA